MQPWSLNPSSLSTFPTEGRRSASHEPGMGMVMMLFSFPSQSVTAQSQTERAKRKPRV